MIFLITSSSTFPITFKSREYREEHKTGQEKKRKAKTKYKLRPKKRKKKSNTKKKKGEKKSLVQ